MCSNLVIVRLSYTSENEVKMKTEIEDSKVITPISNGNITILFRGRTFRGTNRDMSKRTESDYQNQVIAIYTIQKYLIEPIQESFPGCRIKIILCTYKHVDNSVIVKFLEKDFGHDVELTELENEETGQIYSFRKSLELIKEPNEFVFILRPDLVFMQEVDFQRADKEKILFQWNLFTNWKAKRISDLYQFIGGNVFEKFRDLVVNKKFDNTNPGTLHNLYNFLIEEGFTENDISYLNYIKNPNPQDPDCLIKGNPNNGIGNPMFKLAISNKNLRRSTN